MSEKCPVCGNSDVQEHKEEKQPGGDKRYAVCIPNGHQLVGPSGGPWRELPKGE
jgi:hypothetical protein